MAVDPGADKCGVAVVDDAGKPVYMAIVGTHEIVGVVEQWAAKGAKVVVGRGTGHKRVVGMLREGGVEVELEEERGTSLEARRLYWEANPRRGWRRLVPVGLLVPPKPVDDWAAVVIARRFLARGGEGEPERDEG